MPAGVMIAGSFSTTSLGRLRWPIHSRSGSSDAHASAAVEPSTSHSMVFLRPADTWLIVHVPRWPSSNRSSRPAASSLSMCSRTRAAPSSMPARAERLDVADGVVALA